MKFRPCIDIHNGQVKQIVGSSLLDQGDQADENYVSEKDASFYAEKYARDGLKGGHIILLNAADSDYYEADREQARRALTAFPGGMQIGGGVNDENAAGFLDEGASHVIVTSFVFHHGMIDDDRLNRLVQRIGKDHLVLDLSCRRKGGDYYIVTDRWQKFTDVRVSAEILDELSRFCDEFLIHAVDVEGKSAGIDEELVSILGRWTGLPVTYAGGVRNLEDLELLMKAGSGKLDVTVGSALDLFGGKLPYEKVLEFCRNSEL